MEGIWNGELVRFRWPLALVAGAAAAIVLVLISAGAGQAQPASDAGSAGSGPFQFDPLPTSAPCTLGGNPEQPLLLPEGYTQSVIASEPQFPDLPDMNTHNETGPDAGRFLYRTHETATNSAVSVTDLETGETRTLAQRADWERFDGIVWTKWGTILAAEEVNVAAARDPAVPQAEAGLVYEIDPETGAAVARPALGSKSHEGMRFDPQGNLYSISESNPGYIFKFVPDRPNDLSSGQLYALKVVEPTGDRTGEAIWVPLDRATVQVNANAAAGAAGATGYNRPEDVEIATSTGNNRGGATTLYVSVTGEGDNRVLGIDLREPAGGSTHDTAYVYDYVRPGLNAPADFEAPDNLALDRAGNLYITEDPPTNPPGKGADIWVAEPPSKVGQNLPASSVVRFASVTDCTAEPTGIYFKMTGRSNGSTVDNNSGTLFVNIQHRGGDGLDKAVAVTEVDSTNNP